MTKSYIKKDKYGTCHHKDEACTILHRENGPAIKINYYIGGYYDTNILFDEEHTPIELEPGMNIWVSQGKLHRENGPALEFRSGPEHRLRCCHGPGHVQTV